MIRELRRPWQSAWIEEKEKKNPEDIKRIMFDYRD